MRSIGPAVPREQSPAFLRNANGRLGLPGPTQGEKLSGSDPMATLTTTTRPMNVDVGTVFDRASNQFRGLNMREPGQWPLLPKICAWIGAALVVVALGWVLLLSGESDELDAARAREPTLKTEYRAKLAQAVNLAELRRQKQQVQEFVNQLEKQLPGKADMDALISDINQAGIGRGLQFELLRPGAVQVKDYYAELPI